MPEIERSFLAEGDLPDGAERVDRVEQGYLAIDGDGTEVRIRRRAGVQTLTVKSAEDGRTRTEEELEIDAARFERLWPLTAGRRLAKDRHLFALPGDLTAEVDVYVGELEGLRVVEVEFPSEEESDRFQVPDWFGREVTGDRRYRNRELAVRGLPRDPSPAPGEPQRERRAATAFGSDPERYDRSRPRYPAALIERIAAAAPGGLVLDVGAGTGIVARQLQAAGCRVIGVDPDARLAEFARRSGVEVEVSTFEAWEAAGRRFDAVVSGESWHWVDPAAGAVKAAEALRPGGPLVVFWNTGQPAAGLDEAFAEVYRRVLPESLVARLGKRAMEEAHVALCAKAADGMRAAGAFAEPEQSRLEWERSYTREEWLDALQTSGGVIQERQLGELLEGVGAAIDAAGGSFTMNYATFVVTAVRRP